MKKKNQGLALLEERIVFSTAGAALICRGLGDSSNLKAKTTETLRLTGVLDE